MDAVFYPNIYKKEEIFRQEGWNYHLESEEGPLTYNGVVYNEMKGAFSSPDDVLERETINSLFPDTTYGCESGGDPVNIPDLSYENSWISIRPIIIRPTAISISMETWIWRRNWS